MSEVKNIAKNPYLDFVNRLSLLAKRRPQLIAMALGNIFTMRLIGNKTHGDLAEVAVTEFVNQYMYDFSSVHVGKKLFRAKSKEEDIVIKNEVSKVKFPVSLKAYGSGPLQLSTDKESQMYQMLEEKYHAPIKAKNKIKELYESSVFSAFSGINILSLIYDEAQKKCNMLVFDAERARKETVLIRKEIPGHKGRKHPVYRFLTPVAITSAKSGTEGPPRMRSREDCGRTLRRRHHFL